MSCFGENVKRRGPRPVASLCAGAVLLALGWAAHSTAEPAGGAADGAGAGAMRSVSGSLTYLPRIALDPEAEVMIEVDGVFGTAIAGTSFATDGAQVPVAVDVALPQGLSGTLRAVIRQDGRLWWRAPEIAIAAGDGPVDLGVVVMEPYQPLGFVTRYQCGEITLTAGMDGDQLVLRIGARDIGMKQQISASGARFVSVVGGEAEFWSQDDMAMLVLDGEDLPECTKIIEVPRPYRATGNEPGWAVTMDGERATVLTGYGTVSRETGRPVPEVVPGGYVFDLVPTGARLFVTETLCRDDATGMPHPHRARLEDDGENLWGCGGDPADLLRADGADTGWTISKIEGEAVADDSSAFIVFDGAGRVAGSTGCNRFFGGYALTGEGLSLSQIASTMMACPAPRMEQERRIFDALSQVRRFDLTPDGALVLLGDAGEDPLIIATR